MSSDGCRAAPRAMGQRAEPAWARFTKVDHFELELDLPEAPDAALRRAREVLSEEGDPRDLGEEAASARAVSAAGAPKEQGTRVRIGAYALEGLIKQRAARKAATRIAELLGPHGVVSP